MGLQGIPLMGGVVDEAFDALGPVNSLVETSLGTLAIPKSVAAGDLLIARYRGDTLNNTGSSQSGHTLKVKIGATTALTGGVASLTTSANRRIWEVTVEIRIKVPTNDLWVYGRQFLNIANTAGNWGGWFSESTAEMEVTTEDLTAGKSLDVTFTLGAANASLDWIERTRSLTLHKKAA